MRAAAASVIGQESRGRTCTRIVGTVLSSGRAGVVQWPRRWLPKPEMGVRFPSPALRSMPRWTDLTSDQCADVRVARDLVAFDGVTRRWPLDGIGVADLRPMFGAGEDDPMYDGWEVPAAQAEPLGALAGQPIDLGAGTWTVEASGQLAARLGLEGPGGYLFVELLDHRV